VGQDICCVVFPSKAGLTRLRKIRNIPIEGTKMFLHFEECQMLNLISLS
jgi:hypothetical protein